MMSALLAAGGVVSLGPAAAQQTDEPTNETTTDTGPVEEAQDALQGAAQREETQTDSGPDYLARIADGIVLTDYRTRSVEADGRGKMLLDVRADRPEPIRYADAFGPFAESGVSEIDARVVALDKGEQTLGIECTEIRGQIGVSVATQDSFGIAVSEGLKTSSSESLTFAEALTYGGGVGVLGTGIAAWRRSRDDLDSPTPGDEEV
jgi:hypothetical protein